MNQNSEKRSARIKLSTKLRFSKNEFIPLCVMNNRRVKHAAELDQLVFVESTVFNREIVPIGTESRDQGSRESLAGKMGLLRMPKAHALDIVAVISIRFIVNVTETQF